MRVRSANKVGFCFGVKRAVTMAQDAISKNDKICSLGSLIHNAQVVDELARRGLKVIKDAGRIKCGAVVISSHGISPRALGRICRKGVKVIDTTCPFVRNAQRIAKDASRLGYTVVILGDAAHPEVRSLVGFAGRKAIVLKDSAAVKKLGRISGRKIAVISQTTQSPGKFSELVKAISIGKPGRLKVFNTICRDAEERQEAARRLARSVDTMLVIGGSNSANTRRLYEVCKAVLRNSHLVESEADLGGDWFRESRTVGVTSGASTPDWIVKRVIDKINGKGAV